MVLRPSGESNLIQTTLGDKHGTARATKEELPVQYRQVLGTHNAIGVHVR